MSNLADQPLIPCPSIAKYWQSYITEMMTWWQNQEKVLKCQKCNPFSKDIINTITWLPFFIEHNLLCPAHQRLYGTASPPFKDHLLIAEVGVDAVKDEDHRKISFQSMALGSNFIFLFTLKSKKMQHDCDVPADADTKFRYPSLKCSMNKNKSKVVLNNSTILCTWYDQLWNRDDRVKQKLIFLKKYSIIFLPLLFLHNPNLRLPTFLLNYIFIFLLPT